MKKFTELDIIGELQKTNSNLIYGAYFTREGLYFFEAENIDEIVKEVEQEGGMWELYPEFYNNNEHIIRFRSDNERIIFGNPKIAAEFSACLQAIDKNE